MSDVAFILITDPDTIDADALATQLRETGYACLVTEDGSAAYESMESRAPDVVVCADALPGTVSTLDVLRKARTINPAVELFVVQPQLQESSQAIVRTLKGIPHEILTRPLEDEELRRIRAAAERSVRNRLPSVSADQHDAAFQLSGLLGRSETMQRLVKRVRKLARSKSTVIIQGETGVGKELFAQLIHLMSPRAGKPFKVINCAAISESLAESELFGHVKGAFTGALGDRRGVVEAADGGTLFLDEIGDMPLPLQAKLLRTIETGEITPVGSSETRYCDVRFVAATNRDLQEMVAEGKFREDLFYRLHAQSPLTIAPLRDRAEDIPLLVQRFIQLANKEHGTNIQGATPEVVRRLQNVSWPGNVRELRNVVERMCIEAEAPLLDVHDLPESIQPGTDIIRADTTTLAGMSMAEVERWHIANTLAIFNGNREQTAQALKIGARTLYRKLREYGLS